MIEEEFDFIKSIKSFAGTNDKIYMIVEEYEPPRKVRIEDKKNDSLVF